MARNFGHPYAVQCLIDNFSSPINILMDADFQDNPALIPSLLKAQETSQADIVRVARGHQDGSFISRVLFYGFRRLYRFLTKDKFSFGTFGLYSSRAVASLKNYTREAHFYFPGVVGLIGLKTEVLVHPRLARKTGRSRVGIRGLFKLALDAFFSFSVLPLRLASIFGMFITVIGAVGVTVIVYLRLFTSLAIPGWSSILSAVTFFGGVQLLFLGILGEYVGRIFEQVKGRPRYFVASSETINPNV